MSDRPMDLSSLGHVPDADIVRGAVRRFRRRVLKWSAWVLLVALGASALVAQNVHKQNSDYRARIFEGGSWNGAVAVYDVGGVTVQVQKVTVIPGHRIGLVLTPAREHGMAVIVGPTSGTGPPFGCPPTTGSACAGYGVRGVTYESSTEGCQVFCEQYIALPLPTSRDIPMAVQIGNGSPVPFMVSLDDLKVPSLGGR